MNSLIRKGYELIAYLGSFAFFVCGTFFVASLSNWFVAIGLALLVIFCQIMDGMYIIEEESGFYDEEN